MTVSLAALLVSGTLLAMRRPLAQAGSRGVAEQVAEFLRGARQQAITEQAPVAVLLPTAGGTNPCSQSVALARGEAGPLLSRVLNLGKENPATVLFVGTYPATGTWSLDAPDLAETNFWGAGFAPGDEPLSRWTATRRDFIFLFNPRGSVLTNNLPCLDGSYRIVVSQGVTTGASSATGSGLTLQAPPPSAGLTSVAQPYTVSLSSAGAVSVEQGLTGYAGGGVAFVDGQLATNPAPPLAVSAAPEGDPEIMDVELFPPAGMEAIAQGVDATLQRDREMTIRVRAKIATPEDLFCNITVTGVDGSGSPVTNPGSLSSPGARRMRYQPEVSGPFPIEGHWVTEWAWLPPVGLPEGGTTFTITAQVKSKRSSVVTTLGGPQEKTVRIFDRGRIYFGGVDPYTGQLEVFMVRADGSDLTRVTHEEPSSAQDFPTATRDGNKLLFASVDDTGPGPDTSDLFALSRLGGLSTRITEGVSASRPSFSDDSTVAVFEQRPSGLGPTDPAEFYAFDPNGTWPPPRMKIYDAPPGSTRGMREPVVGPIPDPPLTAPFPACYSASDPRRACRMRRAAFACDLTTPGRQAICTARFCLPGTSPADGNVASITEAEAQFQQVSTPGAGEQDGTPCWSPDPTRPQLVWIRTGPAGRQLWARDLNDPAEFLLTGGLDDCFDPCYCPDGTALVVGARVSGKLDLYIIPLNPGDGFKTAVGPPQPLGTPGLLPFSAGFVDIKHPSWSL